MNDPRGPVVTIAVIEERSDCTMLTKSCGHTSPYNQIFHYKVGAPVHCVQCLDEADVCPACGKKACDCGPGGRP
jgi:hypothetical protein